jgi:hypothetical protein
VVLDICEQSVDGLDKRFHGHLLSETGGTGRLAEKV